MILAITQWEAEVTALIPKNLNLKVYRSHEQPPSGKMVAIYGRPGVGKTDAIAQLADCKHAAPLLYINIEGGAWVFSHRDDITIINVHTWSDFAKIMLQLSRAQGIPFRTIIVDNGTELQAINVLSVMGQIGASAGIQGSAMPSQQQWGASTAQMLNSVRLLHEVSRNKGVHVIFTAHEDARKDSITNAILKSGIGFTPSLARSFPGIVDIVGHLTVQNDAPNYTRVMNFAANPHSDAKFRRSRGEAALTIPLTIAYQNQKVLVDVFNTLIGGEPWPKQQYDRLASKAQVAYATSQQDAGASDGVVDQAVAQRMATSTDSGDNTTP